MKLPNKKTVITAAVILAVIICLPFIDYFVMKPTSLKMRVIKAINYIKDEKFDRASELFGYHPEGTSNPDRAKTREELQSRLEDMSEQGIKLLSVSGVDYYRDDGMIVVCATVTISDGKKGYKLLLQFVGQGSGIAPFNTAGTLQENPTKTVVTFIQAIDTYYPG